MAFVAGKSIKVNRGGELVQLKPGDPVPEAATWRNRQKELAWGRIKEVPDDQVGPQPEPEPVAPPPPEPEATEPEADGDPESEDQPKKRGRKKKGFFGGD